MEPGYLSFQTANGWTAKVDPKDGWVDVPGAPGIALPYKGYATFTLQPHTLKFTDFNQPERIWMQLDRREENDQTAKCPRMLDEDDESFWSDNYVVCMWVNKGQLIVPMMRVWGPAGLPLTKVIWRGVSHRGEALAAIEDLLKEAGT